MFQNRWSDDSSVGILTFTHKSIDCKHKQKSGISIKLNQMKC